MDFLGEIQAEWSEKQTGLEEIKADRDRLQIERDQICADLEGEKALRAKAAQEIEPRDEEIERGVSSRCFYFVSNTRIRVFVDDL